MPNCPKCGETIGSEDSFCSYCGTDLSQVDVGEQTAPQSPPPAVSPQDQRSGEQQSAQSYQEPRRQPPQSGPDSQSRRTLLQAGAAVLGIGGIAYALQSDDITVPVLEGEESPAENGTSGGDGTVTPQSTPEDDGGGSDGSGGGETSPYGGWLNGVSNYEGRTYDFLGFNEVTVTVGAVGNGGNNAFGPSAILVDPGTTVRWEGTDGGAAHSVTHQPARGAELFDSPVYEEQGIHFEYTFDEAGTYRYYCRPHEALGMKAVVAVGRTEDEVVEPEREPTPESTPEGGETYPSQAVRLFVPNGTDRMQLLATLASDHLGVEVQIEQLEPGEMLNALDSSDSDGYTVGVHTAAMMGQYGMESLFETARPVGQFLGVPSSLTVAPDYAQTVDEFLQRTENESGQAVTVLQPDIYQTSSITARVLREYIGTDTAFEIVPSDPQVAFGRVLEDDGIVATTAEPIWAPPQLLEELNLLAVFGENRLVWWEDVPTFQEATGSTLPPMEFWEGVIAPRGTPPEQIDRLAVAIERAANHPEFQEHMRDRRLQSMYRGPDGFRQFLDEQGILYSEYGEL
jgi:halocyanin-like protein